VEIKIGASSCFANKIELPFAKSG